MSTDDVSQQNRFRRSPHCRRRRCHRCRLQGTTNMQATSNQTTVIEEGQDKNMQQHTNHQASNHVVGGLGVSAKASIRHTTIARRQEWYNNNNCCQQQQQQ